MVNVRFERNTLWEEAAPSIEAFYEAQARAMRAKFFADTIMAGADGVTAGLRALAAKFQAWQRKRAAYEELMALDDRMLKDIGISRTEIPAALEGDVRGGARPANENVEVAAGEAANSNSPRHAA